MPQDRSVSVRLSANVTGYVASLKQASLATKDFASSAEKHATKHKQDWDKVGKGMLVTGGVIGAGVGLAVKAFMDFDKQMSVVKSVATDSSKSVAQNAKDMEKLGKAAMKAGADTVFSASEAAKAEAELAKAGVSTADILGGALTGSLDLASAGGLDLANAAEIAAQSMNVFKLEGKDVSHIADVLAAGANKSAADVGGLGDSLRMGGLVAAQYGLTLETTVGTLSAFADNALIGSDAGTALKSLLQQLTPTSDEAAGAMESIGFSAYDASGQFVGMEEVAKRLQTGLGGLSDQQRDTTLKTIFGGDAVRGANVLYEQGAAGIKDYTKAVNDNGAAARMAKIQLDNLAGDIETLKGSIETGLIGAGSAGNDVLRSLTQTTTSAVNAFGSLPEPVQAGALKLAGLGAAVLVTGGAFLVMVPKVAAAKGALVAMGVTSERVSTGMRTLGTAVGVAGVAFAALEGIKALTSMNDYSADVEKLTTGIRNLGNEALTTGVKTSTIGAGLADFKLQAQKIFDPTDLNAGATFNSMLEDMTGYLPVLDDSTQKATASIGNYDNALGSLVTGGNGAQAAEAFKIYGRVLRENGATTAEITALFPAYQQALDEVASTQAAAAIATGKTGSAAKGAVDATKKLALHEEELKKAADKAKVAHDALTASITGFSSAMLTARGDARAYEAAIDAASASLKENGRTLDITTEKGRNNAAALDGIASAALSAAESTLADAEANGTLNRASVTVTGNVGKARTAFINAAVSMGMNKTEAAKLATQTGLTAGRVQGITNDLIALGKQKPKPKVDINKAAADTKIAALKANIKAIKQGRAPGISANTATGKARIAALQKQIDDLRGKHVVITTVMQNPAFLAGRLASVERKGSLRAAGGPIRGAGTGTSDDIPAWLSNGEHVLTAADVVAAGGHEAIMRYRKSLHGFAGGGPVKIEVALPSLAGIKAALNTRETRTVAAPSVGGGIQGGSGSTQSVLVAFGRMLQSRGFQVGEHPLFGGVAPVHTRNSRHYSGRAIDVNHDQGNEMGALDSIIGLAHARGLRSIWRTTGHYNHAHFDYAAGGPVRGYAAGTNSAARGWSMVGENGPELARFHGGETVIPNHRLAAGGPVGYAAGGFVAADFSAVSGRIPTYTTRGDHLEARIREIKATKALTAAEASLDKLRRTKGHTAKQVSAAEDKLAQSRRTLSAATKSLRGVETLRAASTKSYATKFHVAAKGDNNATGTFLTNIDKLRAMGFGALADQLLMSNTPESRTLAAQAARKKSVARTISADVARSARLQKSIDARQAAVEAKYAPKEPALPKWALPVGVAASSYGARPAPGRIQSIVVKIGDKELTQIVTATVDGQTQQLVDGLVYGG